MSKKKIEFKDDKMDILDDDIKKVQASPSQHIGSLGNKGCLHLAKEDINNHIDECIAPHSMGKEIDIVLNCKERSLTTSDNSRGIPPELLEKVFTILSSSTKLVRENGSPSTGTHGFGNKTINALSDQLVIISKRYDKQYKLEFKNGVKQGEIKEGKCNGEHGLTVKFIPSETFLGKGSHIDPDDLRTWIEMIHYMLPEDITINFYIHFDDKKKTIFKKVYKNKNGMADLINNMEGKSSSNNVHLLHNQMKIKETVNKVANTKAGEVEVEVKDRFLGLEFAFAFENNWNQEENWKSFCNFCHTFDHGVHFDAVKQAMEEYFKEEANKTINKRDAKDLKITAKDVQVGMYLAVYLSTDMNVQFISQIKSAVGNGALHNPIRKMALDALKNYFIDNPSKLKDICSHIKTNARARIAGINAKKAVVKETQDKLANHRNKNLTPANNNSKGHYREIWLVEGDSAGNSSARYDQDSQALFKLRGFPANVYGQSPDKALSKEEMRNLILALGCNIGKKFDINKLHYDKIIILTDSDADGAGISSLLCSFFVWFYPEIIEAGKLYKCTAPLYKLELGRNKYKFINDKIGFIEEFRNNIGANISLLNNKDKKISRSEMESFLDKNKDYFSELTRLESRYTVHRDIIDFIVNHTGDKKINSKINKRFPEIHIDNNVLVGIYEGQYQRLVIDEIFMNHARELIKVAEINNQYEYKIQIKSDINVLPIGKIVEIFEKYRPTIKIRYKGLGELDASDLKETTFNPNNRKLLRLRMDDIQRELERFDILHGNNDEARKELFTQIPIDKELLDN